MVRSSAARHDERRDGTRAGGDEADLDEAARRESLRAGAPGTVGTRIVIRECGNVTPRGRFADGAARRD